MVLGDKFVRKVFNPLKISFQLKSSKNLDKKLIKAITKKLSLVKLGGGIAGTLATGFVIAAKITVAVQFFCYRFN